MTSSVRLARWLALAVPALLLGGAYVSQYGFGLFPCEMCWWQRYPHFIAVLLALASFVLKPAKAWIVLAAVAIMVSGAIGAFHAGVEYGWWEGLTSCSTAVQSSGDPLAAIMDAPLIRCDVAPWTLAGISLAGFNAIISIVSALVIFVLLRQDDRA